MIASGQTIRKLRPLEPFEERSTYAGMTYGVGPAGYDIRIAQYLMLMPTGVVQLASSRECFSMPDFLLGVVHDKSTWARRGLAVQNTVIEPGWRGYLTLELTNHGANPLEIQEGCPIAQIIFHLLDEPAERPYEGKYQDQAAGPQPARSEP